jgi:hypothetical protein
MMRASTTATLAQATTVQADVVPGKAVVHYLHFTARCRTCLGIQATIEKTMKDRFAAETASGALAFQDINLDLPENSLWVPNTPIR